MVKVDEAALEKIAAKTYDGAGLAEALRKLAAAADKYDAAFAETVLHYSTPEVRDSEGVWLPSVVLRVKLSGEE